MSISLLRRCLTTIICVSAICFDTIGYADPYPTHTITMIVPADPGGIQDVLARQLAKGLNGELGQTIVVQDITGAGGNIGTARVARAKADGYTLLVSYVGTQAINPSLYKNLGWSAKSVTGVAMIASYPYVIVVNSNLPVHNIRELISYAKEHVGQLNYGSGGIGSSGHIYLTGMNRRFDLRMTHVPFNGSMPAVTELLSGRIQVMVDTLSTLQPYLKSGQLRPIAVTGSVRLNSLKDVMTVAEQGYPELVSANGWCGIFSPVGVPAEVLDKLNAAIKRVVDSTDYKKSTDSLGFQDFNYLDPISFNGFVNQERTKFSNLVKLSGATVE